MSAGQGLLGRRLGRFFIAAATAVALFIAAALVFEAFPSLGGVQLTQDDKAGPKKCKDKDDDTTDNDNGGGNSKGNRKGNKGKGNKGNKGNKGKGKTKGRGNKGNNGNGPKPRPCPTPSPSPTIILPSPSCSPGGYGTTPGCPTPSIVELTGP